MSWGKRRSFIKKTGDMSCRDPVPLSIFCSELDESTGIAAIKGLLQALRQSQAKTLQVGTAQGTLSRDEYWQFSNFFCSVQSFCHNFVIYKLIFEHASLNKPPKSKNRSVTQKCFLKQFSEIKPKSAYWNTCQNWNLKVAYWNTSQKLKPNSAYWITSQNWNLKVLTETLLRIETQLFSETLLRIDTFKCVRYSQNWNRKVRTETLIRIKTQQHSVVEPEPQEPQLFALAKQES